MPKLKIAASTYLNSAPLVYSFLKGSLKNTCEFLGDTAPARCADLLRQNLVDAALIPVIEYQTIKQIYLVPNVAVAAKESVQSVILVAKCPINKLKTVTLDTSSRTSATLVQIILEIFYKVKPIYLAGSPNLIDMLKQSDAALIIGDPAIKVTKNLNQAYQIYDLAEEWRKFTSLPFVFACWGVNKNLRWSDNYNNLFNFNNNDLNNDLSKSEVASLFVSAKTEGLNVLEEIAREYSKGLEIEENLLLEYLRKSVNYDLDSENLAGLNLFYKLAFEYGLIKENRLVEFISNS